MSRVRGGGVTVWDRTKAVLKYIRYVSSPIGVEVGVWRGAMSYALLTSRDDLFLYMVDSWLPSDQQPIEYRNAGDCHARASADQQKRWHQQAIKATSKYASRRDILHMDSVVAAQTFGRNVLDFAFIDADHSYEGVQKDLSAWWPRIQPSGWLCGHDYGGWSLHKGERRDFGVKQAVDEFASEMGLPIICDEDYTWFIQKPTPKRG